MTNKGDEVSHPFDLSGKVAVVTGANTGIGQGIAVALAEAGADVALVGRSAADETAGLVRAAGRRAALIGADLSTEATLERAAENLLEQTLRSMGSAASTIDRHKMLRMIKEKLAKERKIVL